MPGQPLEAAPAIEGSPGTIRGLKRRIERAAKHDLPVLIVGETGTGKEVVARAIYHQAPRGPFVTIDCSSLVSTLVETELFGHTRGAFTGATGKAGLIEAANGGTAFFDEIGELPLEAQAKLLRVLQEKEYRPVGSVTPRRASFRVLAATNRDLEREVKRGTFREDLFFRLNVYKIRLAPLRERPEDIPVLVEYFLRRMGAVHRLTGETMDALLEYEWPGNVRELENCIQQMVAANSGPLLHVAELPSAIQNHLRARKGIAVGAAVGGAPVTFANPGQAAAPEEEGAIEPLDAVERRMILRAIRVTGGDRARAACLLGIGRTTLYRRLRDYGYAD